VQNKKPALSDSRTTNREVSSQNKAWLRSSRGNVKKSRKQNMRNRGQRHSIGPGIGRGELAGREGDVKEK